MNLLSIGGSNSKTSINRLFANYTASLLQKEFNSIDISTLDLPLFSVDLEAQIGTPTLILELSKQIDASDLIVISLAENNGSYNVGFKNMMDWLSRIKDRKTWGDKKMLLLSTSPGVRGGMTVLEQAKGYFPFMGAQLVGTFSLPKFYENFDSENGIINTTYHNELLQLLNTI